MDLAQIQAIDIDNISESSSGARHCECKEKRCLEMSSCSCVRAVQFCTKNCTCQGCLNKIPLCENGTCPVNLCSCPLPTDIRLDANPLEANTGVDNLPLRGIDENAVFPRGGDIRSNNKGEHRPSMELELKKLFNAYTDRFISEICSGDGEFTIVRTEEYKRLLSSVPDGPSSNTSSDFRALKKQKIGSSSTTTTTRRFFICPFINCPHNSLDNGFPDRAAKDIHISSCPHNND
ncbi:hypothetical protein ABFX02_01G050900 [Erythranthe guttata]